MYMYEGTGIIFSRRCDVGSSIAIAAPMNQQ
jgi:hypothetical protein